ncbi:hypothetical protein GE09DRAFT_1171469 [Coniochaeta sp. 2T2.1]|nr:hypothetical protein GE09DRAFT_1171469 [Coniochaeta sp. 2T2.1]
MTYNSPAGSTPRHGDYYYEDKYASPSPTPSPRGASYYYPGGQTPQRPATRAHFRGNSSGAFDYGSPRTPQFSPRYNSDGLYATATPNVSSSRSAHHHKSRHSGGYTTDQRPPRTTRERDRRHSASYYRASDHYGESDEDEFIEINGVTYVLPARSRTHKRYQEYHINTGVGYDTNYRYYSQTAASTRQPFIDRDPVGYSTPRSGYDQVPERRPSVSHRHARRNSSSVPQRPQTARPSTANKKPPPQTRKATKEDAQKHRIPEGYSLKNWDPSEEPIMLLGSVFDANSLGKWIYDWTVFNFTGNHPISDCAGDLWMLLIQLAGKIKRAEEIAPQVRSQDNREIIEDFIESGERLTDKLRKLLKTCEAPMLKSAKKAKNNQLGLNAGVEFVNTLWGRDRELERTEQFMASVRLWNMRYEANCEVILLNPGM